MEELIKVINETFPQENDGFTNAVFFHHDKDGNLKTCSPFVSGKKDEQVNVQLLVKRLKTFADACNQMANDMVVKTLPKS